MWDKARDDRHISGPLFVFAFSDVTQEQQRWETARELASCGMSVKVLASRCGGESIAWKLNLLDIGQYSRTSYPVCFHRYTAWLSRWSSTNSLFIKFAPNHLLTRCKSCIVQKIYGKIQRAFSSHKNLQLSPFQSKLNIPFHSLTRVTCVSKSFCGACKKKKCWQLQPIPAISSIHMPSHKDQTEIRHLPNATSLWAALKHSIKAPQLIVIVHL